VRGEPGRVAERVRALLEEHGRAPASPTSRSPAGERAAPPAAPRRLRLDPGRRGALAVGVAVVAAAVLTGVWVLSARPSSLPVSSSKASSGGSSAARTWGASGGGSPSATGAAPVSPSSAALVVVDVAGKVRHPGLYRLPPGSRVDDAIRAAGGARPGVRLDGLNLAAKLVDGQQVAVGIAPAAGGGGVAGGSGGGGGGGASGGSTGAPVNLNTATVDQLQTLPGVGPVLAQHILDWRSQHGSFTSVDQLDDVTGIGDVKFAALKPLVTV